MIYCVFCYFADTPSITAKLINEQKEDKEKKNHEEREKMKADCGFQDNYSVVVASGNMFALLTVNPICSGLSFTVKADIYFKSLSKLHSCVDIKEHITAHNQIWTKSASLTTRPPLPLIISITL